MTGGWRWDGHRARNGAVDAYTRCELPIGGLAIADLHLDAAASDVQPSFASFLRAAAGRPELWILGDLFDAWVGPAHARLAGARRTIEALRRLRDGGTRLRLVPGNRDFLLDAAFTEASGVEICAAGILARDPRGATTLFVHGDELCTLDRGYQRLKRVVRSPLVRGLAPRLPDAVGLWAARRLRSASRAAVAAKPAEHKQQQASEVLALAGACGADSLVCGHAHRFVDQRLDQGPRWIVLDAFGGERDLLEVGPTGEVRVASSQALQATREGSPSG